MLIYPKSLGMETKNAQLLLKIIPGKLEIDTEKKGLKVKSNPIKLEIENKSFFDSMGLKSLDELARDNIILGKNAVVEVMQKYAEQKKAMSGPDKISIGKIQFLRAQRPIQHMMSFIPKNKPSMKWKDGTVDMEYEKDIVHLNWIPPKIEAEYIPYSVEMFIEEWAEVESQIDEELLYLNRE